MKVLVVSILSVCLVCLAGCFPTMIHKTVTVEKDPEGKIIRILEVEEVTQHLNKNKIINLEYLKIEDKSTDQ